MLLRVPGSSCFSSSTNSYLTDAVKPLQNLTSPPGFQRLPVASELLIRKKGEAQLKYSEDCLGLVGRAGLERACSKAPTAGEGVNVCIRTLGSSPGGSIRCGVRPGNT